MLQPCSVQYLYNRNICTRATAHVLPLINAKSRVHVNKTRTLEPRLCFYKCRKILGIARTVHAFTNIFTYWAGRRIKISSICFDFKILPHHNTLTSPSPPQPAVANERMLLTDKRVPANAVLLYSRLMWRMYLETRIFSTLRWTQVPHKSCGFWNCKDPAVVRDQDLEFLHRTQIYM